MKLLDDDGENKAVRWFLACYGGGGDKSIGTMKLHLEMSGFGGCWPEWCNTEHPSAHLTKGGAQLWIRHLFSLEAQQVAVPAQEARVKPLQWSNEQEPCDGCRYNHVVADSGLGRFSVEWKGWKDDSYTVYLAGEHIGDSIDLAGAKLMAEQYAHRVVLSLLAAPQGDKQ